MQPYVFSQVLREPAAVVRRVHGAMRSSTDRRKLQLFLRSHLGVELKLSSIVSRPWALDQAKAVEAKAVEANPRWCSSSTTRSACGE